MAVSGPSPLILKLVTYYLSDSVRNSAEKRLSYESILMSKGSSTFSKEGTTDESNDVRHSGQGRVAASAVLSAPSSASTSGSSSYRPHAIVVNVVQVG